MRYALGNAERMTRDVFRPHHFLIVASLIIGLCLFGIALSDGSNADVGDSVHVDNFEYSIISESQKTVELVAYTAYEKDVVIPSVISIGNEKYSVISIGTHAFSDNISIRTVVIGDNVIAIKKCAFESCSNIRSVTFGKSVEYIGDMAFRACSSLKAIHLPASVTYISDSAFNNIDSVTEFVVSNDNPNFSSKNGMLFNKDLTELIRCPPAIKSFDIPDSVITIGINAFVGCKFLDVMTIPSSVTTINADAFINCKSLTEVTIPDNVRYLGPSVFHGCSGLTKVTLGSGIDAIHGSAFYGCINLRSITIPDTVKKIGDYAFEKCALESISLPDTLESIGSMAFLNNKAIKSVTIPKNVTHIGERVFLGCIALTEILVDADNTDFISIDGVLYTKDMKNLMGYPAGKEGDFVIPDGVESIASNTFDRCVGLKSVTIPSSVTIIWNHAFYGCTSLTSIIFSEGLEYIEMNAFDGCSSLESVDLPDSLKVIPEHAFNNCINLSSVKFGSGLETICDLAFKDCTKLKSILIPANVSNIGTLAFLGCSALEEISIEGANITYSVKDGMLFNFDKTILIRCNPTYKGGYELPDTVISIGDSAFRDCVGLTSIGNTQGLVSIGDSAFRGCKALASFGPCPSLTHIGDAAFSGCEALTFFNIGTSTTFIGNYAFDGCVSIANVIIKDGVEYIGFMAFNQCKSLRSIVIPKSVTYLGSSAFNGCSSLTEIIVDDHNVHYRSVKGVLFDYDMLTLIKCPENKEGDYRVPDGIVDISDAFTSCSKLTSIVLPASVKKMDDTPFIGTRQLQAIIVSADNPTFASVDGVLFDHDVVRLIKYPENKQGEYVLPESTVLIQNYALDGCVGLTKITLPSKLETPSSVFLYDCPNLTEIVVIEPNEALSAYDGAVYIDDMKTLLKCPDGRTGSITVPASLEHIDRFAFHKSKLTSIVVLGGSVLECESYSFLQCNKDLRFVSGVDGYDLEVYTDQDFTTPLSMESMSSGEGHKLYLKWIEKPTDNGDNVIFGGTVIGVIVAICACMALTSIFRRKL